MTIDPTYTSGIIVPVVCLNVLSKNMFISRAKADSRFIRVFCLKCPSREWAIPQTYNEGLMFSEAGALFFLIHNVFVMKYMYSSAIVNSFHDLSFDMHIFASATHPIFRTTIQRS